MRRIAVVLGAGLLAASAIGTPAGAAGESCWGELSAAFAQTGAMGTHSAEQATPRVGLANLARALFDAGVLDEPSLDALAAWLADELGYELDACTD